MSGGGARAAYQVGVLRAISEMVPANAPTPFPIICGTSAGAINAAIIATHFRKTDDHGANDLDRFWHEVATPSVPWPASLLFAREDARRWDAVWTSLLRGNPHMFTPRLWPWPLIPPALWTGQSFYGSAAMKEIVDRYAATVDTSKGGLPRLMVTAVGIESGRQQVFDSSDQKLRGVTTTAVVASGSLPPSLPSTTIGGRHYWDGGLWSNTPLPDVIKALKKDAATERPTNGHWIPRRYHAIVVDVWRPGGSMPQSYWEAQQRINEFLYADKTRYDESASRRVNRYVELIWELRRLAETENIPEDSPLRRRIADEYARCADEAMLAIDVTVIKRTPLPGDDISHEIDFSPDRIQALIDQGARDAEVIADHLRQRHTRDTVRSGRYGETASPRAT